MNLRHLLAAILLAAGCTSTAGGGSGGGSTTTTTTTAPTTPASCSTTGCGAAEFCKYPYAACKDTTWDNFLHYNGQCTARPQACDAVYAPVCGCDGKVYGNECAANAAGVDLGANACATGLTPDQYIPCGPLYCSPATSYCRAAYGDEGDTYWDCIPLPAACQGAATPDCACLGPLTQGAESCKVIQGNGVSGLEDDKSAI
jgi:hypothetical protein